MSLLLSIAIPTKDRYDTLFPVLEALLKYIKGSDFEIIVQDNTQDNTFALNEFKRIQDEKIKYFHQPEKLTVTENSNLAIEHCSGEYLTFIGDDDLISPYVLQLVNGVKSAGLDCLIYERGNYFWNGLKMNKQYAFHYPASLQVPKNISTIIQKLNVKEELNFVLNEGGIAYYNLPTLYHGIVKRETMMQLKAKFGDFVPGSCPDVAIATALTTVVENYGYMRYPVTITGASKKSAAGLGARSAHIAKIEDVPWLPKNLIDSWDPEIPRIWTGMTIYAQNIHEVFVKAKIASSINYDMLYANLFIKEPKARKVVIPYLLSVRKSLLKKWAYVSTVWMKSILFDGLYAAPSFIINLRFHLKGDFKQKSDFLKVNNVDACMNKLLEIAKPEEPFLN